MGISVDARTFEQRAERSVVGRFTATFPGFFTSFTPPILSALTHVIGPLLH